MSYRLLLGSQSDVPMRFCKTRRPGASNPPQKAALFTHLRRSPCLACASRLSSDFLSSLRMWALS